MNPLEKAAAEYGRKMWGPVDEGADCSAKDFTAGARWALECEEVKALVEAFKYYPCTCYSDGGLICPKCKALAAFEKLREGK